jgi:hypothetical protein
VHRGIELYDWLLQQASHTEDINHSTGTLARSSSKFKDVENEENQLDLQEVDDFPRTESMESNISASFTVVNLMLFRNFYSQHMYFRLELG